MSKCLIKNNNIIDILEMTQKIKKRLIYIQLRV